MSESIDDVASTQPEKSAPPTSTKTIADYCSFIFAGALTATIGAIIGYRIYSETGMALGAIIGAGTGVYCGMLQPETTRKEQEEKNHKQS